MEPVNRILSLDLLKGISMYLVIFTHCLQYIAAQTFENTLFQVVYVFHMPLFIIVSGYLFRKKIDRPLNSTIANQFVRLIIPSIVLGGGNSLSISRLYTISLFDKITVLFMVFVFVVDMFCIICLDV